MLNIKGLLLGNFRVFSGSSCFRLAPITILTGPNGSGKSTITGSLSLLKGLDTSSLPFRIRLDSGINPFGSFDMMTSHGSKERTFTAGFDIYNIILGEEVKVVFTFEKGRNFDAVVTNINIRHKGGNLFDFKFDKNRIYTKVGLKYMYGKLKEIRNGKKLFLEIENKFRQIRSASGSYNAVQAEDENIVRIFHVDNDVKRKNLYEYLNTNNISTSEYERLFYFFGNHRHLPGSDGHEAGLTREAAKIVNEYSADRILLNSELLIKILEIPIDSLNVQSIKDMMIKSFPELYDCLLLLNNPESLNKIVDQLKNKDYPRWEEEFLNSELASSRRIKVLDAVCELEQVVDHNIQARFDNSRLFRPVTEVLMTRESFQQSYQRYKNVTTLSSFCSLILKKIIHDMKSDLDRSMPVQAADINKGMTLDLTHPMHDLIRNYSMMKGKDGFLKTWFRKFRICDDFAIDIPARGMGYSPGIMKNEEKNSLAAEGAGTNRLIMILLGIANARHYCDLRDFNEDMQHYPSSVIIEQPESGLHPSWQLKLADMFADARKELGMNFIVETHSEHIINKLQYLVSTGKLSKDDVLIYYLDQSSASSDPQITEIVIDENGNLSRDLPFPFLDEEDCKAKGMFKLRKVSRN